MGVGFAVGEGEFLVVFPVRAEGQEVNAAILVDDVPNQAHIGGYAHVLDRDATGELVLLDGEFQAAVVPQGAYGLNRTLAEGGGPEDYRPVVELEAAR